MRGRLKPGMVPGPLPRGFGWNLTAGRLGMKKVVLTVLACALAAPIVPVRAADDSESKFEFNGMVRSRYEYMNNYFDLADQIGGVDSDDHLSVAPYRAVVGITGNFAKNVSAHVDLQYTGHWGDQWNP